MVSTPGSKKAITLKRFFILFLLVCNGKPISAGENLALNKSYKLTPAPNYKLCTDDLDKVQLTDGRTYGSWWVNKSTVGWNPVSTGIEIAIDLQQSMPIDEVKVYSVGGGFAGVEFPQFIAVLVSDDNRTYGLAGLIGSEDLANLRSVGHNRIPHTFVIDDLNTQGRYVKVVVRPNGRYFFLDEIEVIGNKSKLDVQTGRHEYLLQFTDSSNVLGAIEDYQQLRANIGETIKALQSSGDRFPADFVKKVWPELESIAKECNLPTDKIYSQNGLFVLRKKLGVIRAEIYRKVYNSELACFAANPMETVFEKDMCFREHLKEINVQLWQNEYESAAFNIVNCCNEPVTIAVSVSPLAGPAGGNSGQSEDIYNQKSSVH